MTELVETRRLPASELVKAGLCSPQCMVASEAHADDACRCRCEGVWHGVLADVLVESEAVRRPWWEKCHRGGWSTQEVDSYIPVCQTTRQENARWKQCRSRREPFVIVTPSDHAWRVVHDHATLPYRMDVAANGWRHASAAKLGARFLGGLLQKRRIRSAGPPPGEHVFALGIRSLDEAKVIATLLGECFMGNFDGISRAICVLEGHQDPCELGLMPMPYLAGIPVPSYPWMPDEW